LVSGVGMVSSFFRLGEPPEHRALSILLTDGASGDYRPRDVSSAKFPTLRGAASRGL
jgi:hypothetical protein